MLELLMRNFKKIIVALLQIILALLILFSSLELIANLVSNFLMKSYPSIGLSSLLELLGNFLLIIIGLELLDTMTAYLRESVVSADAAEIVLIVALTAACRKAIVLDYSSSDRLILFGISTLLLALSISYFLLRLSRNNYRQSK